MTTTAWFDEQDRLPPEDLLTVTFPVSRLGRRGYEEEPVKLFVRAVHGDEEIVLRELYPDRSSLYERARELQAEHTHV